MRIADAAHCAVVVSGDLAFSGRDEQFTLGYELLQSLTASLVACAGGREIPTSIVMVPGNHDCDFDREGKARELMLEALRDTVDESILAVATEVQAPFFEGLQVLAPPTRQVSRLEWTYELDLEDVRVAFRCFNTAWCSTLREQQGKLRFPSAIAEIERGDLTVAVLHHPFNWLASSDARRLSRALEGAADIILTGHEHEHTRRTQYVATGERNEFIEGGVLGDREDSTKSAFNLLLIDSESRQQRFYHFSFRDGMYQPVGGVEPEWEQLQVPALRVHRAFELSDAFSNKLDELGVSAEHPSHGRLRLPDIFVYPDLRRIHYNRPAQGNVTSSGRLPLGGDEPAHYLITGGERSCKTSLTKRWFKDLLDAGIIPVLLDGKSLRYTTETQFDEVVKTAFAAQYSAGSYEQYRQLPINRRALMIDDFHAMKIRSSRVKALLDSAEARYHHVILVSNDFAHQVSAMTDARRIIEKRKGFSQYHIEQFGHLLRDDFVQKWFTLDPTLADDAARLARKVVEAERTLDAIIGKNFVPAYPVFLLAMLQGLESMGAMDLHASTHGYFYELLIKNDLASGSTGVEYDIKVQFLSYLAYKTFKEGTEELSSEEFELVHEAYEREYDVKRPLAQLKAELQRNNILVCVGDSCYFKYDYVRYYFIASFIASHVGDHDVREDVRVLAATLDQNLSANILLFLAHLTKDPFVIDSMLAQARSCFADLSPATLDADVLFLGTVTDDAPDIQFVDRDPGVSRRLILAGKDELENHDGRDDLDEEYSQAARWMSELGAAFKGMQILGQVLKNFPGSLKADPKLEIANECYGLGLRALASMLAALEHHHDGFLDWLRDGYREEFPYATEEDLTKQARQSLAGLTRLGAYGAVQRIASAVGSRDLMETFRKLRDRYDSSAGRLIDMAIRLDQLENFPKRELTRLGDDLGERSVPHSVLCMLTIRHLHLFEVTYPEKQAVCDKLKIPYQAMVKIDPRKRLIGGESAS